VGLKFSGRTPSHTLGGAPLRAAAKASARANVVSLAFILLALWPLVAALRNAVGSALPFDRRLQIAHLAPLSNFAPNHENTRLVAVGSGFFDTLLAPLWLLGETAQTLGPRGLVVFIPSVLLLLGLWFVLAYARGWRRPPVAFLLLLSLQVFGASYWLVSFRTPARKIDTPFTTFDFHTHTTYSSGLLTPQQQINWHRARGFKGLAFTDTDRLMDTGELETLRARNPGMILLNGEEFRGDKHILLFGLQRAITSKQFDRTKALAEAKRQNAAVIAPHPWSPNSEPKAATFLARGAVAVEAWNGEVFDRPTLEAARARRAAVVASTDTLSKSGARNFTWTILPIGLDEAKVLRALRLKKTAVATTLSDADSSSAYDDRQRAQKKPLAVFKALGTAWGTLSRAQRVCTTLVFAALFALLWSWGAGISRTPLVLSGPSRVVGFLKRRRWATRVPGAFFMALAWAGSILAAIYCLSWTQKFVPGIGPLHALAAWIVCDALYIYGRALWKSAT
jgi:hypothetical protein